MQLLDANNHAALLIQQGQFAEAYFELRQAMEEKERRISAWSSSTTRKITASAQEQRLLDDDSNSSFYSTHNSYAKSSWYNSSSSSNNVMVAMQALSPFLSQQDPMCSSPIVLRLLQQQNDRPLILDAETTRTVCATACFNMGLACHLYLQTQSESALHRTPQAHCQRLGQALYQQAMCIICPQWSDNDGNGSISKMICSPTVYSSFTGSTSSTLLLYLSLCNNLIELECEQDNVAMTEFWQALFVRALRGEETEIAASAGMPPEMWEHFWDAQMHYAVGMKTAHISKDILKD